MKKIALWALAGCFATAAAADERVTAPELTAAQIVEKNVDARGGAAAWRNIQTMVWVGHIESVNAPVSSLPFVLEEKRPNKTRFEIKVQNQITERIYDGSHGWKVSQAGSGRPELEPYTAEELRFAQDGQGIDGPLIDYQAKGIAVTLDGTDEVEGRKTYRLSVKLPSGAAHHVWVDAHTFLDVKYDRQSRSASGQSGTVSVFYRNYQTIEGLQIPLTIESGADLAKATDKMVIDKVALNSPLADQMFARPNLPGRRNAILLDASNQGIRRAASLPMDFPRLNSRSAPGTGSVH